MASTLVQNRRPDWDSRGVRSGFDVTALTLPRFPMRSREPLENWVWRGIKFKDLTKSKNFCAKLLYKVSLIILAKKKLGVRCTLRTIVAWPLCLRHDIIRNKQGLYQNNANDHEKWRMHDTRQVMKWHSITFSFLLLSLHFVPSYIVCILYWP